MVENLDDDKRRSKPPSLFNTLTEIPRTLIELSYLMAAMPLLSTLPRGDQHPVLLLPGFMAGDDSTAVLRRYLQRMGYRPLPWQLGRNTGNLDLIEDNLIERFADLNRVYDCKISIIGQSLGGVYARQLAGHFPDSVRQVITLGSPFGTRGESSTNPLVARLFRRQSGMTAAEMRGRLSGVVEGSTVPCTAIFSKGDGIVNWRVCREASGPRAESVQVLGSHCGMGFNPLVYYIIADRLSQRQGKWSRFEQKKLRLFTRPDSLCRDDETITA